VYSWRRIGGAPEEAAQALVDDRRLLDVEHVACARHQARLDGRQQAPRPLERGRSAPVDHLLVADQHQGRDRHAPKLLVGEREHGCMDHEAAPDGGGRRRERKHQLRSRRRRRAPRRPPTVARAEQVHKCSGRRGRPGRSPARIRAAASLLAICMCEFTPPSPAGLANRAPSLSF
jgi:hypothetical protein